MGKKRGVLGQRIEEVVGSQRGVQLSHRRTLLTAWWKTLGCQELGCGGMLVKFGLEPNFISSHDKITLSRRVVFDAVVGMQNKLNHL